MKVYVGRGAGSMKGDRIVPASENTPKLSAHHKPLSPTIDISPDITRKLVDMSYRSRRLVINNMKSVFYATLVSIICLFFIVGIKITMCIDSECHTYIITATNP